jgi:hypothetical protein
MSNSEEPDRLVRASREPGFRAPDQDDGLDHEPQELRLLVVQYERRLS